MYSRPGKGEDEDDLLRIQQEFLSQDVNPAASVSHLGQVESEDLCEDNMREKRPHERDVVQLQGIVIGLPINKCDYK